MLKTILLMSGVFSALLFTGCDLDEKCGECDSSLTIDEQLTNIIKENALKGDPSVGLDIPSIEDPKAQLGMKLFFTKALGGDKDSACVTCHHPVLGGGDNLSLSIGVESLEPDLLGEGRLYDPAASHYDNGYALVPRNAPSTYNVALFKRSLFWDGRVENVIEGNVTGIRTPDTAFGVIDDSAGANLAVAQARFPVTSHEEMKGFSFELNGDNNATRTHLALRLSDDTAADYISNSWQDEFTPVYGADSITFANIVDAIGEYERSQLFVNSAWKKYVQGDKNAISEAAKRGAKLFFNSYGDGGMSCTTCHSGDFFTDESFHVMAVPQVGQGKNSNYEDFGRFNQTATDKYAFRTPTLLNVEMTGPWGHDGAYTTLEAMVRHMINPDEAIANYDYNQLDENVNTTNSTVNTQKALTQLQANKTFGISPHHNINATDEQVADLVAFLKALTDPCLKDRECIGKWIPENSSGPDGLQLNAVDKDGNLL